MRARQPLERTANQWLEVFVLGGTVHFVAILDSNTHVGAGFAECEASFTFSEAETLHGLKRAIRHVARARRRYLSVRRSIRVTKLESSGRTL